MTDLSQSRSHQVRVVIAKPDRGKYLTTDLDKAGSNELPNCP